MRAKEARDISISEYLDYEGIKPAKQRLSGRELWYSSPLRTGDSHPSFKVDTVKNLWFDFGLFKGGNIVDLVCELTNSTVKQALAILDRSEANKGVNYRRIKPTTPLPSKSPVQTSLLDEKKSIAGEKEKGSLELIQVTELQKPYLLEYLQFRKIDLAVARLYLKQISFKPPHTVKSYYALGFPSGDGFEARNKVFKGFVGMIKEISTINLENNNSLSIFEGFMDFLAFLSYRKITNFKNSVIILNTVNLRKQALDVINGYNFSKVYLFLDNDEAGERTKQFFIENIKNTPITDKSSLYKNYKDFNQMTMEN